MWSVYGKEIHRNRRKQESVLIIIDIKANMLNGEVKVETNIKNAMLKEVLSDVVRSKIGMGKDDSVAENYDIYDIHCTIDLDGDIITTSSNCGNKSLETGILGAVLQNMSEDGSVSRI